MPRTKPENEQIKVEVNDGFPVKPLTIEFNREDLNQLRDKINEVISHLQ